VATDEQNELAHSIIESLLDHTRVVSDLIALMAQALDQDTTKALTLTPQWQAYLESRRQMEKTRVEVERFAEMMKAVPENPPRINADSAG
jgi:chemotaxis regulatin CheY-phosphate phosphatase CheZ